MLVHQDAEIVDPDLCAKVRRTLRRPRGRRRRLRRRDRRAQHRLVGGLGHARVVHQPLRGARRRRPALLLVGRGTRRRPTRTPARSTRSTASCSCSRPGRCATCASTSRSAASTATTSTSACRSARPGRKVVTADFRAIHHRALRDAPRAARSGSRRTSRVAEKWDGRMPRVGTAPGELARAGAARRGRARRRRARSRTRGARARGAQRASSSARSPRRAAASRGGSPRRCAARRRQPMIAFGVRRLRDAEAYRRYAAAGRQRAPPSPTRRCHVARGRRVDLPRLQPPARHRCGRARRTSRRSCSCDEDTEIADRDFCAKVRARARRPGRGGRRAAPARRGVRTLAWWEGEVSAAPSCTATTSTAAASCPPTRWARAGAAARRGRHRRRLPARAVAVGGAQRALRRGAAGSATASTSTTACRSARPGARSSPPTCASIRHRPLEVVPATSRSGSRAHIQLAEKWDGRLPGPPPRPEADWKRAPAAPRPSARRRARCLLELAPARRAGRAARARAGGDDRRAPAWRLTAPLRRLNGARRRGRFVERAADLVARDHRLVGARRRRACAAATAARRRAKALDSSIRRSTASWRAALALRRQLGRLTCLARCGGRGSPPGARAAGCGPTGRGCAASVGGVRRVERPHDAEAEERRARRPAAARGLARRSPRPRSARRCARRPRARPSAGRAARRRATPGSPGNSPPPSADRVARIRGDLRRRRSSRRGARAASTTSWKSSSGSSAALRALGDQPQLLGDRAVVVVAVDHDRVGQLGIAAARRGSSRGSARARRAPVELHEAGLRRGVDRAARARRRGRPVDAARA